MCEDVYGEAQSFYIVLWKDGLPVSNPTIAAGDFQISIDGGVFVDLDSDPVVDPTNSISVRIDLTAAEKTGDQIMVFWSDPDNTWEPNGLVITTCTEDTGGDTYQAKVELFDDDGGVTDRYVAVWFKNAEPITAGITSPTIKIIKVADGTNLVPTTAMDQVAALGLYRFTAVLTQRIASGVAYVAEIQATIDAATRTWYQPIGRDS